MVFGFAYQHECDEAEESISYENSLSKKVSKKVTKASKRNLADEGKNTPAKKKQRLNADNSKRQTVYRKEMRSRRSPIRIPTEESEGRRIGRESEEESEGRRIERESEEESEGEDDGQEERNPDKNDLPQNPLHFAYQDSVMIDKDVHVMDEVPLDFVYYQQTIDSLNDRLNLLPLKSDKEVIYIKKISYDRMTFKSDVSRQIEFIKDWTAKRWRKVIIKHPNKFKLIELTNKDRQKIVKKVNSYKELVDARYKFLEIVKYPFNADENPFTGEFFNHFEKRFTFFRNG